MQTTCMPSGKCINICAYFIKGLAVHHQCYVVSYGKQACFQYDSDLCSYCLRWRYSRAMRNSRNPHSLFIVTFSKKSYETSCIFHPISEKWLFYFLCYERKVWLQEVKMTTCTVYLSLSGPYKHTYLARFSFFHLAPEEPITHVNSLSLQKSKYLYKIS